MDAQSRKAHREAARGGDEEAARALVARVRSGDVPVAKARLLALLQWRPAIMAFAQPEDLHPATDLSGWLRQVVHGLQATDLDPLRVAGGPCRAFIEALERTHARPNPVTGDACRCPWIGPSRFAGGACMECGLPDAPGDGTAIPFALVAGIPLRDIDRVSTRAQRQHWGALTPEDARESLLSMLESVHHGWQPDQENPLAAEVTNGTPASDSPEDLVRAVAWCGRTVDVAASLTADLVPVLLGTGDPAADRVAREDRETDGRDRLSDDEWQAINGGRWEEEEEEFRR